MSHPKKSQIRWPVNGLTNKYPVVRTDEGGGMQGRMACVCVEIHAWCTITITNITSRSPSTTTTTSAPTVTCTKRQNRTPTQTPPRKKIYHMWCPRSTLPICVEVPSQTQARAAAEVYDEKWKKKLKPLTDKQRVTAAREHYEMYHTTWMSTILGHHHHHLHRPTSSTNPAPLPQTNPLNNTLCIQCITTSALSGDDHQLHRQPSSTPRKSASTSMTKSVIIFYMFDSKTRTVLTVKLSYLSLVLISFSLSKKPAGDIY